MPEVAIINQSTVVSDIDGINITNALNIVLPQFCSDWSLAPTTCVYVKKGSTTSVPLKIFLLDTADVSGALAYHDELNDVPYGNAFAKTVLADGGVLLYSTNPRVPTFAQAVCHELFEMLMDPYCNSWAMLADGVTQYAYEVCDPVESNPVTVQVQTGTITKGALLTKTIVPVYSKVGLSDWVLPKWFDTQAVQGPFNHNNTLKAPLTIDKNGYVISLTGGTSKTVWGETITEERKAAISAKLRVKKRIE